MSTNELDTYQQRTRDTAQYPEVGTGSILALSYCGLGLGEAGEVQGALKKIIRDDDGQITPTRHTTLVAELGDVLWYVARLADEIGVPLSEIAETNIRKLADRKRRGAISGSGDYR